MRIGGTDHDMDKRSLDIFFQGCKKAHRCKGCHNPELWDGRKGKKLNVDNLVKLIKMAGSLIEHVRLMGGEPLDQDDEEMRIFLMKLKKERPDVIVWLFTGYTTGLPEYVEKHVRFLKTGPYQQRYVKTDLYIPTYGRITLASNNQIITDLQEGKMYSSHSPNRRTVRRPKQKKKRDKITQDDYAVNYWGLRP